MGRSVSRSPSYRRRHSRSRSPSPSHRRYRRRRRHRSRSSSSPSPPPRSRTPTLKHKKDHPPTLNNKRYYLFFFIFFIFHLFRIIVLRLCLDWVDGLERNRAECNIVKWIGWSGAECNSIVCVFF